MIAALNGSEIMFEQTRGPLESAASLGKSLAESMLAKCTFDYQPQPEHS